VAATGKLKRSPASLDVREPAVTRCSHSEKTHCWKNGVLLWEKQVSLVGACFLLRREG
jgi:hypothetical protein